MSGVRTKILAARSLAMSTNKKSLLSGSKSTKKASVAKSEAGPKGAKIESMTTRHSKESFLHLKK
jgi:hypothetical protein